MARLDVYFRPGKNPCGYVVNVQAKLLDHLRTRVVIPLLPADSAPPPLRELNPVFSIAGAPHVFMTQNIASIPVSELGQVVSSLDESHDEITRALDILLLGF